MYNQNIFIFIYDQSRQPVRLTKDHTTAAKIIRHHGLTVFPRIFYPHNQEIMIDFLILFPGHHADTDFGILIDKAFSHRITVKVMNLNDIPIVKGSYDWLDLIIEDPASTTF